MPAGRVEAQSPAEVARISPYLDSVSTALPNHVLQALARIPRFDRRFLAAATYLRRKGEIERGWSWSDAEIREFRQTEEFQEMLEQIRAVRAEFARRNPGYSIGVNIGARSLESQLAKWNRVASVALPARILLDTVLLEMTDTVRFPPLPDRRSTAAFLDIITTWEPTEETVPTVAVPGLSKHGQLKAFDFKIYRGRRLIAGAITRTIESRWDRPGWTAELDDIVSRVAPLLTGPLQAPYEPWHYEFDNSRGWLRSTDLQPVELLPGPMRFELPTPTHLKPIVLEDKCETGI